MDSKSRFRKEIGWPFRGGPKNLTRLRKREIPEGILDSDALRIKPGETAVEQVAVTQVQRPARGGGRNRGIQKTVEALLFELNHPFKNWEVILPELRAFALKHFTSYARHPQGAQAIAVIFDVFLDAAVHSGRRLSRLGR